MVKELLTADRICLVDRILNWESGILLAAQPLLKDGSITQDYPSAMVENVRAHGPYIVLADRFALPHAAGEGCVNRVALSLLQVKEPVDLLGKPVNAFLVLATPDNRSHILALSSLVELLRNPRNLTILTQGTARAILEMISES